MGTLAQGEPGGITSDPAGVLRDFRISGTMLSFTNRIEPSTNRRLAPPEKGLPKPLGDWLIPSVGSRQLLGCPQGFKREAISPAMMVFDVPSRISSILWDRSPLIIRALPA